MLKLSATVLGLAITAVPAAPQTPPTAQRFTLSGNLLRGCAALKGEPNPRASEKEEAPRSKMVQLITVGPNQVAKGLILGKAGGE